MHCRFTGYGSTQTAGSRPAGGKKCCPPSPTWSPPPDQSESGSSQTSARKRPGGRRGDGVPGGPTPGSQEPDGLFCPVSAAWGGKNSQPTLVQDTSRIITVFPGSVSPSASSNSI